MNFHFEQARLVAKHKLQFSGSRLVWGLALQELERQTFWHVVKHSDHYDSVVAMTHNRIA
jgi:hypothetical protein